MLYDTIKHSVLTFFLFMVRILVLLVDLLLVVLVVEVVGVLVLVHPLVLLLCGTQAQENYWY